MGAECECVPFRPPPGLSLPAEVAPPGLSPIGSSTSAGTTPSASENSGSKHDREEPTNAEWRIDGISEKLRLSGVGTLVSGSYAAGEFSDVRFIFDAGAAWVADGHNRKRKNRSNKSGRPTY